MLYHMLEDYLEWFLVYLQLQNFTVQKYLKHILPENSFLDKNLMKKKIKLRKRKKN
jgi:hypothetical protein